MWHKWAKCVHCLNIVTDARFSSSFLMPVCTHCGADNNVTVVTAREVWKPTWRNPFRFVWEEKEPDQ